MWFPLFFFKGPKIIGQLAAQLFHGQVFVIPSLFHSHVNRFVCGIYIWNLLQLTLYMMSKEVSLPVKQAIIRLKNQTLDVAKSITRYIL